MRTCITAIQPFLSFPSTASSNVPFIHGSRRSAHPVSPSPCLFDPLRCLKQLVATTKNYISGRGECLSFHWNLWKTGSSFRRISLVSNPFQTRPRLIQSPVSAQDRNQQTNTSEQDIPVVLVFQAVDLSGGSTAGDRLFFLLSAGCYFRQSF